MTLYPCCDCCPRWLKDHDKQHTEPCEKHQPVEAVIAEWQRIGWVP